MSRESCVVLSLGVLLVLLQNGYALDCWKCTSEYDVTCRDHFNVTRIEHQHNFASNYGNRQVQPVRTDPHLDLCDDRFTMSPYYQKNVCVKVVYKGLNGNPPVVRRECRLVSRDLKGSDCPADVLDANKQVEFCEICETDKCNSAGSVKTNLLLAVAATAFLMPFLRK